MAKIIVLNAPPGCGKDMLNTLIRPLLVLSYELGHESFKEALYQEAYEHCVPIHKDLSFETFKAMCNSRNAKETPSHHFYHKDWEGSGMSPRNTLQHTSENIIKPLYGKSFFGEKLAERIASDEKELYIITDGGFVEELVPLYHEGHEVHVVRMKGRGTFEGDTRDYVTSSHMWESHDFNVIDGSPSLTLIKFIFLMRRILEIK